jgi:antitoxin ParD1/3/4
MSITLTKEQEEIIQSLLATGKFNDVSQVIEVALRLLEVENQTYQQWIEETRAKVDEGIASLERGEGIDGEKFVNQLISDLHQAREAHK